MPRHVVTGLTFAIAQSVSSRRVQYSASRAFSVLSAAMLTVPLSHRPLMYKIDGPWRLLVVRKLLDNSSTVNDLVAIRHRLEPAVKLIHRHADYQIGFVADCGAEQLYQLAVTSYPQAVAEVDYSAEQLPATRYR